MNATKSFFILLLSVSLMLASCKGKKDETALQPIDENTAYIAGLGRNGGEQVRLAMDHEKQQITLDFAGLRFLKE